MINPVRNNGPNDTTSFTSAVSNGVNLLTPKSLIIRTILYIVLLAGVMTVCILQGPHKISFESFKVVLVPINSEKSGEENQNADYRPIFHFKIPPSQMRLMVKSIDYDILVGVRIPRVILAALVGAALAAAGVVLQAILRNPLAEPYILGVSSGAALGVVTAVLLGLNWKLWGGSPIAGVAFVFALGTVCLVWLTGSFAGGSRITSLLLAGVIVNAFFSAVMMLMISIIDNQQLRTATLWLMGNITEKSYPTLSICAIFIVAGILCLLALCQKLNILTFGAQEAQHLGVNPRVVTLIAFVLASFITAVAVSLSGLVGFVGLVVPHCMRLVYGPDHRQLLPASVFAGAAFVVICDTIARTIIAPAQLPVGVLTAIIGGPVFLLLLAKHSKKAGALR